jgi:hypothetical protein
MEIKPPVTPASLPVNDTQRLDSTSRQIDSTERAAFETQFNAAEAALPEAAPAPLADPGEARVGQDPWLSEGVTSQRLLMSGVPSSSSIGEVSAQSLPDAVRTAVDFVFNDTL